MKRNACDYAGFFCFAVDAMPSIQKPPLMLRLRQHAMLGLAEPAIAVAGDETVADIPDRSRNHDRRVGQRPSAPQSPSNPQRGGRSAYRRDHLRSAQWCLVDLGAAWCLASSICPVSDWKEAKSKYALRVVSQDELHALLQSKQTPSNKIIDG